MGVVRGSIPRESISFCRRVVGVVMVDAEVVGGFFFGAEVELEHLSTPRRGTGGGNRVWLWGKVMRRRGLFFGVGVE
jgi:hypothetical protein